MIYATKQDMIDRFSQLEIQQLTDKSEPPAGAINDVVLNRALQDASGDIEAALNGRYALPLASVPPVLVRVCCNLTRYYLYEDGASEAVKRRFDDDKKFLDSIAKGTATLGLDGAGASVAPAAGGVEFNDSRRVFGATDDQASRREFG